MLQLECESCGKTYRVKSTLAGKSVKCRNCAKTIAVPSESARPSNEGFLADLDLAINDAQSAPPLASTGDSKPERKPSGPVNMKEDRPAESIRITGWNPMVLFCIPFLIWGAYVFLATNSATVESLGGIEIYVAGFVGLATAFTSQRTLRISNRKKQRAQIVQSLFFVPLFRREITLSDYQQIREETALDLLGLGVFCVTAITAIIGALFFAASAVHLTGLGILFMIFFVEPLKEFLNSDEESQLPGSKITYASERYNLSLTGNGQAPIRLCRCVSERDARRVKRFLYNVAKLTTI